MKVTINSTEETKRLSGRLQSFMVYDKTDAQKLRSFFRERGIEFSETYHFKTYHFDFYMDTTDLFDFLKWCDENEVMWN